MSTPNLPIRNESVNFTRPNDSTPYTSGDLVANNTAAGSVVPLSWAVSRSKDGSFIVRRVRVKKSTASVANSTFRLHLYTAAPTVANGDNAAWSSTFSGYVGFIDIIVDKAFSDPAAAGAGGPIYNAVGLGGLYVKLGGTATTLYGLLEARGAYTPGAQEVFTVTLELEPVI